MKKTTQATPFNFNKHYVQTKRLHKTDQHRGHKARKASNYGLASQSLCHLLLLSAVLWTGFGLGLSAGAKVGQASLNNAQIQEVK